MRILAGAIGEGTGVLNTLRVGEAIKAAGSIPVILEGCIATKEHILECAKLGASAVLVNSAFASVSNPVELATELRVTADMAWRVEAVS